MKYWRRAPLGRRSPLPVFLVGGIGIYCYTTSEEWGRVLHRSRSAPVRTNVVEVVARVVATVLATVRHSLHAMPVPADRPGIFFYIPNHIQVPFGNGTSCVGAPVTRLPVSLASVFGDQDFDVDNLVAPVNGGFTPGSLWIFQAWVRDLVAGGRELGHLGRPVGHVCARKVAELSV
jgi:hypothetical protein